MEEVGWPMIFLVSSNLFLAGKARNIDLLALLRGAALRGHTLFVVDHPYGSSTAQSAALRTWLNSLDLTLQQEVFWILERVGCISPNAVTRGATKIVVSNDDVPEEASRYIVLRLDEAIRLSIMPLFVLVENALSDGAFIRRAMPPAWQRKLREWERLGVVRFEHGGGVGEMKRIVDYCAVEGSVDPLGLGSSAWKVSHVLISDRDSQDIQGSPSVEVRNLLRCCEEANMEDRLHILNRRDQEAYLPGEALKEILRTKDASPDRERLSAEIEAHLTQDEKRHHIALPKIGENSWFKSAFLVYESRITWNDAWFLSDGSAPEMVEIAEKIAAFL